MADKSFSNELQRALARPDIDELRQHLDTYHRYSSKDEDWPDEANAHMDAVMDAHYDNPERGLAYIALAIAKYDEADFIGLMAAGLLEDLLHKPNPELLERIVDEARKNARMHECGGCLASSTHTRSPIMSGRSSRIL